jgi:lipase
MAGQADPMEQRVRANGIELAYCEWRRELRGQEPTILLAHAAGFHARCWNQVIARLGERHVIAVDQRGHGQSENAPIEDWRVMGTDLTDFVRKLALRDAIGVGHSMGGHMLTLATAAWPEAFGRLVLVDPVIMAPDAYASAQRLDGRTEGALHPATRRKNAFESPDAMFERFKDRSPYSFFEKAALRDYCEFGLVPADDGYGYVLACPPESEASMYMTGGSSAGIYESVRAVDIPVRILRAKERSTLDGMPDLRESPTWPELAKEFRRGFDVYLPDESHFMPMESSELVARHILSD